MGKGAFAAVFGQAMRALPACCREGAHGEKWGDAGEKRHVPSGKGGLRRIVDHAAVLIKNQDGIFIEIQFYFLHADIVALTLEGDGHAAAKAGRADVYKRQPQAGMGKV